MNDTERHSPLQMISEAFDQPDPSGPLKTYLLCSTPRSGSYFLCRLLHALGIGVPHEYFNANYTERFGARHGLSAEAALRDPQAYWRLLETKRSLGGWVGAKLQLPHLTTYFGSGALNSVLQRARFVYLVRRDLQRQALSWQQSLATGMWSFNDEVTTAPMPHLRSDADQIGKLIRALATQDAQWRVFFAEHGLVPHLLAYEDLIARPQQTMAELCKFLGHELDEPRLLAYLKIERPQAPAPAAAPLRSLDDGLALPITNRPERPRRFR